MQHFGGNILLEGNTMPYNLLYDNSRSELIVVYHVIRQRCIKQKELTLDVESIASNLSLNTA